MAVLALLLACLQSQAYVITNSSGWPSLTTPCVYATNTYEYTFTNDYMRLDAQESGGPSGRLAPYQWLWFNNGNMYDLTPYATNVDGPMSYTNMNISCPDVTSVVYPWSINSTARSGGSTVEWNKPGYYRVTGDTNIYKFNCIGYGHKQRGGYTAFSWRMAEWQIGYPFIDLLRTYPYPDGTATFDFVNDIMLYPNHHPIPMPGWGNGSWYPVDPSTVAKWNVDGQYGDTYTLQVRTVLDGPVVASTNIVSSTNNITGSGTEAMLTLPPILVNASNATAAFLTLQGGTNPCGISFGEYGVKIPAHGAAAIACQLDDIHSSYALSNMFLASTGNAALYLLVNGTNQVLTLDSSTNWSAPGTSMFNNGGLLWNSNNADMWVMCLGDVPTGLRTNAIPSGWSYQCWCRPETISLNSSTVDFPSSDGDMILKWNQASNAWITFTFSHTNKMTIPQPGTNVTTITNWWGPSVPSFSAGECFAVWKPYATNWIRYARDQNRHYVWASWDSSLAVNKAVVTCGPNSMTHPWTNGQNHVTMCPEDHLYFELKQSAIPSSDSTVGTITVQDNATGTNTSVSMVMKANQMAEMYWLDTSYVPPLVHTGQRVICPNSRVSSIALFPTNVLLTVAGVDTAYTYTVWTTPDLTQSWKAATGFQPTNNGYWPVLMPFYATSNQMFFKVTGRRM